MEWIEVTGETLVEAEEHALQMLGIERNEAEFLVLEEPKSGILRLRKGIARIRARIKPREEARPNRQRNQNRRRKPRNNHGSNTGNTRNKRENKTEKKKSKMEDSENLEKKPLMEQSLQEELLGEFFAGLFSAWQLSPEINFNWPKDYICEVSLTGEGMDDLVGYNGSTLRALETVAAVALKKKAENTRYAQVHMDANGYQEKRKNALEEFVLKLADDVKEAGKPKILEPMNNQDRKVVHDVLGDVEGISTVSEGENPKRRVKIFLSETE